MKFAETELPQIAEDTWKIVLGAELEARAETIVPAAIARLAATVMFGTAQEDDKPEDMHDAMCELVNIVAG